MVPFGKGRRRGHCRGSFWKLAANMFLKQSNRSIDGGSIDIPILFPGNL
jgi:hypothetical protein